mgnify:FL=1
MSDSRIFPHSSLLVDRDKVVTRPNYDLIKMHLRNYPCLGLTQQQRKVAQNQLEIKAYLALAWI